VQDNFVTQWGDPDGDEPAKARSLGQAQAKLPAEFSIAYQGLPISRLPGNWARPPSPPDCRSNVNP